MSKNYLPIIIAKLIERSFLSLSLSLSLSRPSPQSSVALDKSDKLHPSFLQGKYM